MRNKTKRWSLSFLSVVVILLSLALVQTVYAATLTSPATNIAAATDTNTRDWIGSNITAASASEGTVSMTVKGGTYLEKQGYLTLTYTGSSKAILSFQVSTSGTYNSLTIGGSTPSSSYSVELTKGESVAVYIKVAKGNTATVTLSSITCAEVIEGPVTITHNEYGSVTVGGTTVANGGTSATIGADGAELVATPVSEASFVAWVNKDNNTILSQSATYTLKPYATSMNIWAIFTTANQTPYYKVGTTLYTELDTAISVANSGSDKVVVVISDGTLPASSTFNVPSGVSLLVPYTNSDTSIGESTNTDGSGNLASTLEHANATFVTQDSEGPNGGTVTGVMEPQTSITYTLTIPSGTVLNVNSGGKLVIGGTLVGGTNSTTGICSATAGAHSNIQLDGTINVQGGGILSVSGYILGGGTVNAASSATVYQPFVLMDHKDGHYAYAAKEEDYFPYNRHALLNIQSKLVLNTGSDMYGYVAMFTKKNSFASAQFNVACARIVGSGDEEAVFLLGSGSRLEMRYDADKSLNVTSSTTNINRGYYSKVGRTTMTFIGDAALGYLTLTVKAAGTDSDLTTANSAFPIPYNYNVIQQTGSFSVNNHMSLLPGATFTVNDGAGMTISSGKNLVVYDGLRDYAQRSESVTLDGDDETGGTWPTYHYPSSANLTSYGFSSTAELIMNGMLTVYGNLGGTIQTNGTTGKIVMDSDAGTSATAQFGVQKSTVNLYVMKIDGSSGKTTRTLNAQVFTGENSEPLALEKGKTYVATGTGTNTLSSYTYGVYASHDASAATSEAKTNLNATIIGTWCIEGHAYESAVTKPTCTEQGYTTHTCTICGDSYKDSYTDPTGLHTWENGTCSVCGLIQIAGTSVTAGDSLDIYFYVDATLVSDGCKAVITRTRMVKDPSGAYSEESTESAEIPYDEWTKSGSYLRFCYKGIAAKEMTDPVSVTIYDASGKQISTTVTESIEGYALRSLEKHSDAKLYAALVDMLYYGAAAQNYFGYKTTDLATDGLTDVQKAYATESVAYKNITTATNTTYTLAGANVIAESNLYFTFYFDGITDVTNMSAVITYTDHYGDAHTQNIAGSDFSSNSGYYGPRVTGIAVADGNTPITCRLMKDGEIVETVTSSVTSYAVATVDKNKETDPVLTELCNYLMKFIYSAHTYFHAG